MLPYLKERSPKLKVFDILYNEVGHTLNHFLYENCFDGTLVESHYMKEFVVKNSCSSGSIVEVVESGIDLEYFCPARGKDHPHHLTVGYVGRLSWERESGWIVDLVEAVADKMPALNSMIVGEGPMAQNVAERVASSRIRQQIDFRGRADSIVDAMHAIDILVVPSVLDGRPNIIMEANACGVPVIASPVGGIPEMIEEGVNGLLAGPQDVERITRAFATWMADPTSLNNIRAASREKAVKSWVDRQ